MRLVYSCFPHYLDGGMVSHQLVNEELPFDLSDLIPEHSSYPFHL